MSKEDFDLIKIDKTDGHEDYWFNVVGESRTELASRYMEMCMCGITECVYSKDEDIVAIKKVFPFNLYVSVVEDDELKNILKELAN